MNRFLLIAALTTLLVTACGKPAPPPQAAAQPAPAAGAVPTTATATLDDAKALAVMNKAGCAGCHAIDKKILGPSYADVAKKRKGEQGAAAMLVKKIREGGAGAYGSIPMPPNSTSQISDDDLKAMVDWVLTK
ncbi:MAG: c-type cytochrome [Burkholderiales bacterium]|nr:c-type cytochrome [Burkholderiales bacterium]